MCIYINIYIYMCVYICIYIKSSSRPICGIECFIFHINIMYAEILVFEMQASIHFMQMKICHHITTCNLEELSYFICEKIH